MKRISMDEWMNEWTLCWKPEHHSYKTKPNQNNKTKPKQQERHLALIGLNGCENEENRNWKKRKKGKGDWPSH